MPATSATGTTSGAGLYLEMPADGYHLFRIRGHAPRKRDASS